jgi:hypothetical protein
LNTKNLDAPIMERTTLDDSHQANWKKYKDRRLIQSATSNAFLKLERYMARPPVSEFYVKMAGESEDGDNDEIAPLSEQRSQQVKFRKKIHHGIGALAQRYYGEKYDYLLIANTFDRSEITRIVKSYESLLEEYRSISSETKQYIQLECQHRRTAYGKTSLADMTLKLKEDLDFLSPLAETLPTNAFPYVKRAVDSAAKIYELCTGKRVSRNINRLGPKGSDEFQNHGVEFVYVLLNAIDDKITRSNIRSYARDLPKE